MADERYTLVYLEAPEATDVEQVSSDDRGRRIGGGKVPASTNRVRRTETREAFTSTASPARLVRETLAMIVREDWLQSGRSMDDLEGDLTVVGHIERIVGEGSSIELDKYLLPGLNRPMRRMLKSQGKLEGMFEDAPSGLAITTEDLSLAGPAVFLRPAAIYP